MTDHIPTFADFERSMSARRRATNHADSDLRCSECAGVDYEHERWCRERRAALAYGSTYADAANRPPPEEIPQPTRSRRGSK